MAFDSAIYIYQLRNYYTVATSASKKYIRCQIVKKKRGGGGGGGGGRIYLFLYTVAAPCGSHELPCLPQQHRS